jgi:hypothetical protein
LETENVLVILDDKRARSYAKNAGLNYTGIVGLLRLGYKKGQIQDIDSIISELRAIQFHLPGNVEDLGLVRQLGWLPNKSPKNQSFWLRFKNRSAGAPGARHFLCNKGDGAEGKQGGGQGQFSHKNLLKWCLAPVRLRHDAVSGGKNIEPRIIRYSGHIG